MKEEIFNEYKYVRFIPSRDRFGYFAINNKKSIFIDEYLLHYQPITHKEYTGNKIEDICDECGSTRLIDETKTVIDVDVENLSPKQKKEQKKIVKDILNQLIG